MSALKRQTQRPNGIFGSSGHNSSSSWSRGRKSRLALRSSATRMVMAISVIFVILELPAFFSKALEYVLSKLAVTLLGAAANICTTLESFSIFWAYILMNRRFRNRLVALLRCRCLFRGVRRNSHTSSHTSSYNYYSYYTDYSTYSDHNSVIPDASAAQRIRSYTYSEQHSGLLPASATNRMRSHSLIAGTQSAAAPMRRVTLSAVEQLDSPLEIELEPLYDPTASSGSGPIGQSILVANQTTSIEDPLEIKPVTPSSPIAPETKHHSI